tara:strand:- start:5455 stop:5760 length:306 start_codon:yes stop_codon:yes gene_type:complete
MRISTYKITTITVLNMSLHATSFSLRKAPLACAIALLSGTFVLPSHAARFDFADGEGTFVFDTTLSAGTLMRMEDPDPRLIGIVNGGTSRSVNEDSGNLNY